MGRGMFFFFFFLIVCKITLMSVCIIKREFLFFLFVLILRSSCHLLATKALQSVQNQQAIDQSNSSSRKCREPWSPQRRLICSPRGFLMPASYQLPTDQLNKAKQGLRILSLHLNQDQLHLQALFSSNDVVFMLQMSYKWQNNLDCEGLGLLYNKSSTC